MNLNLPAGPYVGLRPFGLEDNLIFFGREDETQDLLDKLHQHRFVAVIGNSGSGKSSLVRAGLIPKLLAGFLVRDRDQWRIAEFRPGSRPLQNFGLALGQICPEREIETDDAFLREVQRAGPEAAVGFVQAHLQSDDANVLIVIDQFEELFRYHVELGADKSPQEAATFVASFLSLARQPDAPIYVVITMRSDFLGDCAAFDELPEAINRSVFLVPRMKPQQIQTAIEAPFQLYGGSISPRLREHIANDLQAHSVDQLPVLQHALMRAYERWQYDGASGPLDLEVYEQIGGLAHAINVEAEQIFSRLKDSDRPLAERMFRSLTFWADGRSVRRPSLVSELSELTGRSASEVIGVIDCFRQHSLLLPPRECMLAEDTVIDITHESLLRQWDRLRQWIANEAESAAFYRRLCFASEYALKGESGPLRGVMLEQARQWRNHEAPNAAWARRYGDAAEFDRVMSFLSDSLQRDRRRSWMRRVAWVIIGIMAILIIVLWIARYSGTRFAG